MKVSINPHFPYYGDGSTDPYSIGKYSFTPTKEMYWMTIDDGNKGYEIVEEEDHILVFVDIPLAIKDSIKVRLEHNVLTITAKREPYWDRMPDKEYNYCILLEGQLNCSKSSATFERGVLYLSISKQKEAGEIKLS